MYKIGWGRGFAYALKSALWTLFIPVLVAHGATPILDPERIDVNVFLKEIDAVRTPENDFSFTAALHTKSSSGKDRQFQYEILMNTHKDVLVKTLFPPNERGQSMLMKGKDFWIYLPNVDQPVRLSLAQRLAGQVSNGDIARMNFFGDYNASLSKIEQREGKKIAVLNLVAVGEWVTYGKVILWASFPEAHPLQAEFYTSSGHLLKTCVFEKYEMLAGKLRPLQITFTDALKKGEKSVLTYSNMKIKKIPAKYFSKDYMRKLN